MKPFFLFLALAFVLPLAAQDLSGYDRILYPVVAWPNEIKGADGSSFSALNKLFAADREIRYFPYYDAVTDGSGHTSYTPRFKVTPAGLADPTIFCCAPSRLGRVLFVEKGAEYTMAETLIARAADGYSSISSIPVVRERDFRTTTTNIIDIGSLYTYAPTDRGNCRTATPQFRHRLRIYDPDATGTGVVRVRIYDGDILPPILISETTVTLDQREGGDPSYPSFAEIPMNEICHPYSCNTPCLGGSQRVEIEPVTPALRFWAFVSGTDNANQRVVVNWPE